MAAQDVEPRMPTLGASEIERVVVLYYGRDWSRAGFEFTGVREVVLETRRDGLRSFLGSQGGGQNRAENRDEERLMK